MTFSKSGDATKAYTEYHNRTLDERAMKIELIVNPDSIKKSDNLGGRLGGGIEKKGPYHILM